MISRSRHAGRDLNSHTLLGALCEVYSGERLGYGYRGKDKSAQIPDHSYRLPVVIGAQPGNTSVFFDNVESGFPQRACWWQVYDQDLPDVAPECPNRRSWHIPQGELLGLERNRLTGRRLLNFCSQVWRDADAALVARHRAGPQADPWTSHDLQTRAKVAAGLALLFGEVEVTDEIWQLSAEPMRMSVATRDAARGRWPPKPPSGTDSVAGLRVSGLSLPRRLWRRRW